MDNLNRYHRLLYMNKGVTSALIQDLEAGRTPGMNLIQALGDISDAINQIAKDPAKYSAHSNEVCFCDSCITLKTIELKEISLNRPFV